MFKFSRYGYSLVSFSFYSVVVFNISINLNAALLLRCNKMFKLFELLFTELSQIEDSSYAWLFQVKCTWCVLLSKYLSIPYRVCDANPHTFRGWYMHLHVLENIWQKDEHIRNNSYKLMNSINTKEMGESIQNEWMAHKKKRIAQIFSNKQCYRCRTNVQRHFGASLYITCISMHDCWRYLNVPLTAVTSALNHHIIVVLVRIYSSTLQRRWNTFIDVSSLI